MGSRMKLIRTTVEMVEKIINGLILGLRILFLWNH